MFITLSWPKTIQEKSAEALSTVVSSKVGMSVVPSVEFEHLKDCEVLLLQTPGLGALVPIYYMVGAPCWQKIEEVVEALKELGVEAQVLINGNQTVLAYAGQEEARARLFSQTLESTREAVKATQRWFKDKRIAKIRQDIDLCFQREPTAAALAGSRAVVHVTRLDE